MDQMDTQRETLLRLLGDKLFDKAARDPDFYGSQRVIISRFKQTRGPRSGVLIVDAGVRTGDLFGILTAKQKAKLRYVFPSQWLDDDIDPDINFIGQNLQIEANWPAHLRTQSLPFADVKQRPGNGRSFTIGRDMRNTDVTVTLKGSGTHVLIGGITGSGKTVTLWTIIRQLMLVPDKQFVLLNGKGNRGLGILNGLPGQVGPMATTVTEARDALGWVYNVMTERNDAPAGAQFPPIFVIADEFDVFTMSDSVIAQLSFYLVKMGRETGIYMVYATQEPKQDMFGNRGTRGQFGTRIALQVSDRHASEAILGATEPRADNLSGSGDAQVFSEGRYTRTLVAETYEYEAAKFGGGEPRLHQWQPFNAADMDGKKPGPESTPFTLQESVLALRATQNEWGRPAILRKMNTVLGYGMGSDRIDNKLMPHGNELARLCVDFDNA